MVMSLENIETDTRDTGEQVATQSCAQEVLSETSVPLDPVKEAACLYPQPMESQLQENGIRIEKGELVQKQDLTVWDPRKSYLVKPVERFLNVETPKNLKGGQKDERNTSSERRYV